jgi:hypothetical protein
MSKERTSKEKKAWRFYRSNLALLVWNPTTESPLADFSSGHFTTDNPNVAEQLRSMGYPEVALDAEFPPDVYVEEKSPELKGDVPLMSSAMTEMAMEVKMEKLTAPDIKPQVPKAISREVQPKKEKTSLPKRRKTKQAK